MMGSSLLKNTSFINIVFRDAGLGTLQSFFVINFAAILANQRIFLSVTQVIGGAPTIISTYLAPGVSTFDSGGLTPNNDGTQYSYLWRVEYATDDRQKSKNDSFIL